MKVNTCKICGATSEETAFYARVNTRCAECHKASVRQHRAENVEWYRAYDAKRYKEDPKVLERHKRYQKTAAGKKSMEAARLKWRDANAEKRAAHVILGHAVTDGRVCKPSTCSKCGSGGRIHGHHEDYTAPLDVVWVCPTCHRKIHEDAKVTDAI